jgi:hypothetical protein
MLFMLIIYNSRHNKEKKELIRKIARISSILIIIGYY